MLILLYMWHTYVVIITEEMDNFKFIPAIRRILATLDISSWHRIKEPLRELLATKVNVEVMLARPASDGEVLRAVRVAVNWSWVTVLPMKELSRNRRASGVVTNPSTVQYSWEVFVNWHSNLTVWLRHVYCRLDVSVGKKSCHWCKLLITHVAKF